MDDADFASLARSYAYDQPSFLRELRRAGLTSLAVAEELGGAVSSSQGGAVYAGSTLLDQSRLAPLGDPLFARLARRGGIRSDEMYVIAYDAPTARRYAVQLRLKFSPHAVRVLRATLPAVWAIRTQSDYFATEGLGLPYDRVALAKALGLRLVPRIQNDEGFGAPKINALLDTSVAGAKASTIVFFGLRNQVIGFPNNLDAAAAALEAHHLNFGSIETYDTKQMQAGNDELARKMPDHIVRVQAISKTEQDKLAAPDIVARYLLGVRERNIRVVYLRPFAHQWDKRSIEGTNLEIVREVASGIRASGKKIGPASAIERFIIPWYEVLLVSLALPAIVFLIITAIGYEDRRLLIGLVVLDLLVVIAAYAVHHDLLARKAIAFGAGLAFPTAALVAIGWAFRPRAPGAPVNPYVRGLLALAIATAVTLCGALVVIGALSSPLTMTEIDRFAGVKYVLVLPALIALVMYFTTGIWGAKIADPARAAEAPVRIVQLAVAAVLLGGAYLIVARSGNQSDIAPSAFELALRSHLTTILQVRPRFKEFVVGFPALMLLPALTAIDVKRWGWLFILAIALGLGDLIDTFSHLHTALSISALRVVNGAVLGIIIGCIAIAVYRALRLRSRVR